MARAFRISEAATLALHAMGLLATDSSDLFSTRRIAGKLQVSEAHLSKVLQRLTRAGLVQPVRGPTGGFGIARDPEQITLLEVYEAIDGPLDSSTCLLGTPVCSGEGCILGDLLAKINDAIRDRFSRTRLSDVTAAYGRPKVGT